MVFRFRSFFTLAVSGVEEGVEEGVEAAVEGVVAVHVDGWLGVDGVVTGAGVDGVAGGDVSEREVEGGGSL